MLSGLGPDLNSIMFSAEALLKEIEENNSDLKDSTNYKQLSSFVKYWRNWYDTNASLIRSQL